MLKLGHMKDIVDLFELALEVESVSSLTNALNYPERSQKSSSELPSTCEMESLRRG